MHVFCKQVVSSERNNHVNSRPSTISWIRVSKRSALPVLAALLCVMAWKKIIRGGISLSQLLHDLLSSVWEWFRDGLLDAAQYRFFEALVMLAVGRLVAATPSRYTHLVEWLLE
jgi:hypothetical protein